MNAVRTAGNPCIHSSSSSSLRTSAWLRRHPRLAASTVALALVLGLTGCKGRSEKELKVGVLVLQGGRPAATRPPAGGAAAGTASEGANGPTRGATAGGATAVADSFGMRGLALALEDFNGKSAAGARPLRLVMGTSDGNAERAAAAFRKLVETEHVPVVIAALTSTEVLACAPFANQSKTVLLTTMATSADVRTAGDYVFRNIASTSASAEVLAAAVARRFPGSKSTIVYPDLEFGVSLRDGVQASLAAHGAPVAEAISYKSRSDDTAALVERLAQSNSPVVFLLGSGGEIVEILKQAKARGVQSQFVLGGDLAGELLAGAGPAADGAIAAVEGFDPSGAAEGTQAFVTAFRARYDAVPSGFNAATYDALQLVGTLMRQGATTGEALRSALYAARGFRGVGGRDLTFDVDGEGGLPPRLVEVRGGRLVPLR